MVECRSNDEWFSFLNGILNPKCSKSEHNGGHFESHALVLFSIGRDHLDFVNLLERTIPKLNHSKSELQNVPILNGFSIRGPTVLIIFCYYILVPSIFYNLVLSIRCSDSVQSLTNLDFKFFYCLPFEIIVLGNCLIFWAKFTDTHLSQRICMLSRLEKNIFLPSYYQLFSISPHYHYKFFIC